MVFWKSKASVFIIKQLTTSLNDKVINTVEITNDSNLKEDRKIASTAAKTVTFGKALEECAINESNNDLVSHWTLTDNKQHTEKTNGSSQPCLTDTINENNLEPQELKKVLEDEITSETENVTECHETDVHKNIDNPKDENVEYNICHSILLDRPNAWSAQLKRFYRKHPPPKKKHAKLLTKYDPVKCHRKLKDRADAVAER